MDHGIIWTRLEELGLSAHLLKITSTTAAVAISIIASWLLYFILSRWINKIVLKIVKKTDMTWDDMLLNPALLRWVWRLMFVLAIYFSLPSALSEYPSWQSGATDLCRILIVLAAMQVAIKFVDAAFTVITTKGKADEAGTSHSLKGISQSVQIVVIIVCMILVVSILVGKNPLIILSGLGASAAVLMLVFQDSILGLVAGVQLTANDMLKPGDWITAPKFNANGTVVEVTLTTVKIRNFDNTIITIPPYSLVSDAFQNWRGMWNSGGRRIMRSFAVDMTSIRFCSDLEIKQYGLPPLGEGKKIVNLTLFRRHLENHIASMPGVAAEMTAMVRELEPGPTGLPIQIYFFTKEIEWVEYEHIQADLLDHILATIGDFGLRIFQSPSGNDIRSLREAAK